ncbi:mediator of RNA polymerase II transcription subunit 16 [Hyalella azteca]|uniref:Mediator of RNA polymerase II transcription subunit 16 n=1 Tax=Hyalella azteca TaxID=294128 RepID=A0A8B7ND96_HYAAZ|nr:mediator of RNA polymerase II transcription subunit 16 [Hyalella azteca]XP_047737391.1 mediator of RNA polymerase II transcription subunit 16 [Hyalella azteca]
MMDLRFNVTQPTTSASLQDCRRVCAVSCKNVVAFTQLACPAGDTKKKPIYCITLADLNCPYQSTIITPCSEPVQLLKFSDDGNRLLVVTQGGYVKLLEQTCGALQPDFETISETYLEGETVLAASFLHNGQRPQINLGEVKVNSLYSEKFTLLKHSPSLIAPGGCATDGVVVVTASGLVLVVAIWREDAVETVRRVLGASRGHYTSADIAFAPDGSVSVSAWRPDVVRCWRLCLAHSDLVSGGGEAHENGCRTLPDGADDDAGKLRLSIECCESVCPYRPPLPDSNLRHEPPDSAVPRELASGSSRVTEVVYPVRDDPTLLLLVLVERAAPAAAAADPATDENKSSVGKNTSCYIVQKYRLEEKTQPVFKLFKSSETAAPSPSSITYKTWVLCGEWCSSGGRVVSLGSCERHLFQACQLPHVISVATEDGTITALNLSSLLPMGSYNLVTEDRKRGSSSLPSGGLGTGAAGRPFTVSLAHTWTGLSLVSYDSYGTLSLFSLVKSTDIGNLWPLCVLLLLEYSLVSGQDYWELLINTPPLSVMTVVDRLMDTLSLHGPSYHTKLYSRMLLLKYSILRLSTSSQHRATETMIQAQASAALNFFRQFRPVTADCLSDKCASTLLTSYLENRSSLEQLDLDKSVDQFMMSVNQNLDCQVEPRIGKYLQPLVQYTAEVTLYLLCSIAQTGKGELVRDVKTLQYLREVLFRARVLHRHSKLVAPHIIRKTDSVDVWAQLYRLLTRLMSLMPAEPDASFIDEVVLLETQVLGRSLSLSLPARGYLTTVTSAALSGPATVLHSPVHYQHGEKDEAPPLSNYQLEGGLPPANPRDPLFLHFIPKDAPKLHCSRCWSVRSAEHDPDNPWEQLWSSCCLCSGHWMP